MDDRQYGVIIADPPWEYRNAVCRGAAANQYPTMSVEQIEALPVSMLAKQNSILLLWATWPQLKEALQVMTAWGFSYVTGFPWVKIVADPVRDLWGNVDLKPTFGVGYWIRGCSEMVLIGRRGSVSPPVESFVGLLSRNFRHSRKPDNLYEYAESLPGPYLELFCRRPRYGWDVWGNEVDWRHISTCDFTQIEEESPSTSEAQEGGTW